MEKSFLNMSAVELEAASSALKQAAGRYDYPEMARYFGSPDDPEMPSEADKIIAKIAKIEAPADANEPLFYFQCAAQTKRVYTLTAGGTVTALAVTPDDPTAVTWSTMHSPGRTVQLIHLNDAKFDVLARETKINEEAMDRRELAAVLSLAWAGCEDANRFALDSDNTYLDFPKLLEMVTAVAKYGKKFVLLVGSDVNVDLQATDYNENKNQSVIAMIERLGIEVVPIIGTYDLAGSTANILNPDRAMLVAVDGVNGKPISYGRKNLVPNGVLNGTITPKQRYSTVVPAIPRNGDAPSVTVYGYGSYQAVLTNSFPIACFGDTVESA